MLGTGNALVTKCYNTCFVIENENDYLMVDAGGGNTVSVSYTHLDVYKRQMQNQYHYF